MLSQSFPPELERFVNEEIAAGNYRSEQDVVVNAVRVLRDVQARQRQFSEGVRLGMDQLERGECTEYDLPELRERFEELKQRVRHRIQDAGGAKE